MDWSITLSEITIVQDTNAAQSFRVKISATRASEQQIDACSIQQQNFKQIYWQYFQK